MHRQRSAAAAALAIICVGSFAVGFSPAVAAQAPAPAGESSAAPPRPRAEPYLGAAGVPDYKMFLPPPPAVNAPEGIADLAIFKATRSLEGSSRWELATSDDRIGQSKMLSDFGCAMGFDLGAVEAPAVARAISRANADLFSMIGASKDHYQRPRPLMTEQGPFCINATPAFAASGSYPSGHSAASWLYGLLLAELDPANSAAILARARSIGESRVVCGVHYVSDVEAGRATATALAAALHSNAEFEADMDAARAEIAKVRAAAAAPAGASCPAAGDLVQPW
jgi:acid phosphatase (class A)